MNMAIGAQLLMDMDIAAIDAGFRHELRWPAAQRVNLDTRLLLLGFQRLRSRLDWTDEAFRTSAVVLGCRLGAMDSYETFDRSLEEGWPAPLSFAHALPSIPLACASLCFGFRGHTVTLTGDAEVGVQVLAQAVRLIRAGRAERAIAGCWETSSDTRRRRYGAGDRGRCLLVTLGEGSAARCGIGDSNDAGDSGDACDLAAALAADDPVARLAQWLSSYRGDGHA